MLLKEKSAKKNEIDPRSRLRRISIMRPARNQSWLGFAILTTRVPVVERVKTFSRLSRPRSRTLRFHHRSKALVRWLSQCAYAISLRGQADRLCFIKRSFSGPHPLALPFGRRSRQSSPRSPSRNSRHREAIENEVDDLGPAIAGTRREPWLWRGVEMNTPMRHGCSTEITTASQLPSPTS